MKHSHKVALGGGIVAVALCITLTAQAAGNTRNQIKSHGTIECTDENGDNVLLTSEDLITLANEIDNLSTQIDAINQRPGIDVTYVYHDHKTGDGVSSQSTIYSYTNPGGCYAAAGHTHHATGTCPTRESDSYCYYTKDPDNWLTICPNCFGPLYHDYVFLSEDDNGNPIGYMVETCYNHNKEYICGYPTNTWTVQCGRRQGEIDQAIVNFK